MKHNLTISVTKKPRTDGVVTCRTVTMREKLMRLLFGLPHKVTILVPGDSVSELSICEVQEGGVSGE